MKPKTKTVWALIYYGGLAAAFIYLIMQISWTSGYMSRTLEETQESLSGMLESTESMIEVNDEMIRSVDDMIEDLRVIEGELKEVVEFDE
ncbi:hypothetical protein LCGC14_2542210 [marine sediment metagenome]|uniref:Uncharacterized protein n=1 Tax=marine sediment metagenome TaxID=412755 RepID=A0A0F9AQF5_9ZZZZ